LISAICTPLGEDDSLDVDALAAHLDDQWRHGIGGALIAGSMGLMQLLSEAAYRDLVRHGVQLARGRGEVLVGAGDTSFVRTLARIEYVEQFDVDGIVVLSPFFYVLGHADLIAYFRGLADRSRKPLYLYDLPVATRTSLHLDTVLELAKHPNIRGIKCSGEWTATRRLMDRAPEGFRVVPAQPDIVDMLVRCGVRDNLDGIYAILPDLAAGIVAAAEGGDYALAAARQRQLTEFRQMILTAYPLFPACSAILNARGIPGRVHPAPIRPLTAQEAQRLFNEPLVRELLNSPPTEKSLAMPAVTERRSG
jgi:4-hydroxy-tetrahydrodipicolinate synthase